MRISLLLVLVVTSAVLLSGCSRKKTEAPPTTPVETPAPAAQPAVGAPQAPPPDAVPGAGPAVTTKASNDSAYIKEMEQTLNEFLGDYVRANHRIPRDINEMLSLKIITSIPAVPNGKRWVIDQKTGKISAK